MSAPDHKQTLLLFKGHPGTGKSTLATALARRLVWPLLDKDDIKDHLFQLPNSSYLSYEVLWQLTRRQLKIGLNVIVDSTLSYPLSFATGQAIATEYGAKLLVIETQLHDDTWRQRLDRRLHEPQTHRTSGWEAMQQLLVEYNSSWRYPIPSQQHLVLNTALPTDQLVQTIITRLAELS